MRDPWRYQCPNCGCHGALVRLVSVKREDWDEEHPYRCDDCQRKAPGRYDKLDGVTRRPDGSIVQDYTPPVETDEPVPTRWV